MRKTLLTVTDLSEETGLGRTKLYELIASGELRAVRIGRAVRVPAAVLDDWVQRELERQNCPEGV